MRRHVRTSIIACLALALLSAGLNGQGLPAAKPEEVGLSAARLERVDAFLRDAVEKDRAAGIVALVVRRGKVAYAGAVGMADREAQRPMRPDTIFRIASMTKPVTSVAAMILYEEGKFLLGDPLSKYIPEFAAMKVLARNDDGGRTLVPARRQITILDLLNHTSGLTYQWDPVLGKKYAEAGVTHGLIQDDDTIADDVKALARIPLLHHPGEDWTYGLSVDVLGYLVEVLSGIPLDRFFAERIFRPLGMKDTYFFLPPEKVDRLAAVYGPREGGGLRRVGEDPIEQGAFVFTTNYPYKGPSTHFSGGGGLCSTAIDYARFAQMLANGGELDGARILSRKTVELMTADHAGARCEDFGFGLGVSVTRNLAEAKKPSSIGAFGWGGFWRTGFFIDPAEGMVGVVMAQLLPAAELPLSDTFTVLAYQAIAD